MRVVVTGASGMIGCAVVGVLRAAGHDVTPTDWRLPKTPDPDFIVADLADRVTTATLLRGAEAVCHLGEIPNDGGPMPRNEIFARNTAVGSQVMQLAAELGATKIIYTSSCQVYGTWGYGPRGVLPALSLPLDETHPLRPQNVYGLSKVANESYARMLATDRPELSVAAFRFPSVLADVPDQRFAKWHADRATPFDGMGTCLDRADAAAAYVRFLEHGRPGFEAYHFVAPEILSTRTVAEVIAQDYSGSVALPAGWDAYTAPVTYAKAREHLRWTPAVNPRDRLQSVSGALNPRPV